ncbi:MAG: ATP-dependent helicase/nuclease subunit [Planctomycetota bacterium]
MSGAHEAGAAVGLDGGAVDPRSRGDRTVVIANAGSGKTWTLANTILRWALDDLRAERPVRLDELLAVTFTRKAAAEILERVLRHAALGVLEGRERADFSTVLGEADPEMYARVLDALVEAMPNLAIGTIDGYFSRVARGAPIELGLAAGWTIGETAELLRQQQAVVARLVAADRTPGRAGTLRTLALLDQGAPRASVVDNIGRLVGASSALPGAGAGDGLLGHYRASVDALAEGERFEDLVSWRWIEEIAACEGVLPTGEDADPMPPALDDAQLHAIVDRIDRVVADGGLPTTARGDKVSAHWRSGVTKLREHLLAVDLEELAKSKVLRAALTGETYSKVPPTPEISAALQPLAALLRAFALRRASWCMRAAREVLPTLDRLLADAQLASGLYAFGDIGRAVARAARGGVLDAPTLLAATGSRIGALALDEAQDTSVEQYDAFAPILDPIFGTGGDGGRFLLVGDPKQSIYGWRGGTPGLIDAFRRARAAQLSDSPPLARSFRSSALLMHFVNQVFGNLERTLDALGDPELRAPLDGRADGALQRIGASELLHGRLSDPVAAAACDWTFTPHSAGRVLPGGVAFYAAGGESQGERKRALALATARIVAAIRARRPESTVAVIVRSNAEVADVVAQLRQLGIDASDEGRSTLLDSPAVTGLLALLRLADDPGDRISHFLASRGPIARLSGLSPLESDPESRTSAAKFSRGLLAEVADTGIQSTVRRLVGLLLEMDPSPRDAKRLSQLAALADLSDEPVPARLRDFIRRVEEDRSSAASDAKVKVMTVHRSKGLEFDEVVLPSIEAKWGEVRAPWSAVRDAADGAPVLVGPLLGAGMREWMPELELLRRDEHHRRLLDDLSGFYVALTRAKRAVHLVFSRKRPDARALGGAEFVLESLEGVGAAAVAPFEPPVGRGPDGATDRHGAPLPDLTDTATHASGAQATLLEALAAADVDRATPVPFWKVEYEGFAFGEELPSGEAAAPEAGDPTPHADDGACAAAPGSPRETGAVSVDPMPLVEIPLVEVPLVEVPLVEVVRRADGARVRAPSDHAAAAGRSLWAHSPFGDDDIAVRGVLVHEVFREVDSIERLVDPAVRAAILARARRRTQVEKGQSVTAEVVAEVEAMLVRLLAGIGRGGSVAEALRLRNDAVRREEARTEVPFVVEAEGGVLVRGRIDRLVLVHEADQVVGAHIVDFKTGAVHADDDALARKIEGYRSQLASYGDAVARLWAIPRAAVRESLLFVDREMVVALRADEVVAPPAGEDRARRAVD